MPTLTGDAIEVEVSQGATVLRPCEATGNNASRFCYHERRWIAGLCSRVRGG